MLMIVTWLGILIIPAAVLLAMMARGRRLTNVPACPRCHHCVQGLAAPTCPECGNDFASSGVITSDRQPISRSLRVLALLLLFIGGYLLAMTLTFGRLNGFIFRNFEPTHWVSGVKTTTLQFGKGPIKKISVAYPGWLDPDQVVQEGTNDPKWKHPTPFPLRLTVTSTDGTTGELFIDPGENMYALQMVQTTGPSTAPGSLIARVPKTDLTAALGTWMVDENLSESPDSPAIEVTDLLVMKMAEAAKAFETGKPGASLWRSPAIWDDEASAAAYSRYMQDPIITGQGSSGGGGYLREDVVQPWMLLTPVWIVLWGLIAIFTIRPGARVEPWTAMAGAAATDPV
ncbi:MAG: hypothetical protein MK116_03265 [Phycisphaerales bacterium]|nr:hypothetical protein [Phycisphaerales bacterium]